MWNLPGPGIEPPSPALAGRFLTKEVRKFYFLKKCFLKIFFLMWSIFKVFIEFVTILLLFMFWYFAPEACGILTPQPGIKTMLLALEGEVLTTGPLGKSWKF